MAMTGDVVRVMNGVYSFGGDWSYGVGGDWS